MTVSLLNVFFISLLGAWIGQAAPSRSLNAWNRPKPNFIGFLLALTVMVLFAGLRNNIGDTYYYVHSFNLLNEAGNPQPDLQTSDYLFALLQYAIIKLGGDKTTFIFVTILFAYIPFMFVLREYSYDFTLSVFFFFTIGIYYTSMNGIRQFIAVGIVIFATKFLFSPKKYHFLFFLIFVIIAYFFHTSSLFMIPLYLVCRRRAWSPSTFMIVAGGIAALIFVSLFLPSFLDMLEETNYSQYSDGWFTNGTEGGANILRVGFQAIPMVLAAIYRKELKQYGAVAEILTNISVIHFAIFLVSLYNWIFARFAFYTYIYVVILLSLIFGTVLRDKSQKGWNALLYIAYMFFFFRDSQGIASYNSDFFTPNNTVLLDFIF